MTPQTTLFYRYGVSLFIGILVGLQREYSYEESEDEEEDRNAFAGIRTFALLGLIGCAAANVSEIFDTTWVFVATVIVVGSQIAVAYFVTAGRGDVGMTTEVAAMSVLLTGALCYWNELLIAVALGVTITVLLSLKLELHGIAERVTRADLVATLKFAIITAIILPVLPNQTYGPLDVLNPYGIWLMVVLISGIGFLGYVLFKVLGTRRGIGLTGLLGGLVSSTATTLSFSQRSQKSGALAKPFALAIIVAWTVMFGRVLIEVAAVNRTLLEVVWVPVTAAAAAGLVYSLYLYLAPRAVDEDDVVVTNPFELRPAITFGLLYGVILFVSKAAQEYVGETGVYLSSAISGLADVDAITLSMAELSRSGNLDLTTASRAIVLATMSNTLVKGGIVLTSGSIALRRALAPGIILIIIAGLTLAFLISI